jgi:Tol biopolymer transport system component
MLRSVLFRRAVRGDALAFRRAACEGPRMRSLKILAPAALLVAALAATSVAQEPPAPRLETLAYVTFDKDYKPTLWSAHADGTSRRKLATGVNPQVSPDGRQIAYIRADKPELWVVAAAGGAPRRLARNVRYFDLRWTADSTTLAFVSGPAIGANDLRLVDVASGRTRTVASGFFHGASFSPDGASLVWSRSADDTYPARSDLYTAPVAGGAATRITTDGNAESPVWGPQLIAFSRAKTPVKKSDYPKINIFTIRPDGSGRRQLTKVNPPFLLAGLTATDWSADGRRLVAEYGGQDTSEVWRVDAVTGAAKDVTGRFDGVFGSAISRDGTAILATTGYIGEPDGDVVSLAWGTGKRTVLVKNASMPSWNR